MKAITVYYDPETDETRTETSLHFRRQSQILRADVFQDAIIQLDKLRWEALETLRPSRTSKRQQATHTKK